jgi:hypothetical protein
MLQFSILNSTRWFGMFFFKIGTISVSDFV